MHGTILKLEHIMMYDQKNIHVKLRTSNLTHWGNAFDSFTREVKVCPAVIITTIAAEAYESGAINRNVIFWRGFEDGMMCDDDEMMSLGPHK